MNNKEKAPETPRKRPPAKKATTSKTRKSSAPPKKRPPTKAEEAQLRTKLNKEAALIALTNTLGVVDQAAREVGIAASTLREWIRNDPEFSAKVQDIKASSVDFVESAMFQAIKRWRSGAANLVQFYLKTQGKDRGYVERTEVVNHTAETIEIGFKPKE